MFYKQSGHTFSQNDVFFKSLWSPNLISGLYLWLNSDLKNITKDSNNKVSIWKDSSPFQNNAIQTSTSLQPTYTTVSGHSAIYFDTTDYFIVDNLSFDTFTIFTVYHALNDNYLYEYETPNSSNGFYFKCGIPTSLVANSTVKSMKKHINIWNPESNWRTICHTYG